MTREAVGLAVAIGLALSSPAWAAPPQINGITPFGAQRGVVTDLAINGGNLTGNPKILAPFAFTADKPANDDSNAGNWKLKLTVSPETAIGVYPIRVVTDDGISNPFLFSVGQLP